MANGKVEICHDMKCVVMNETGYAIADLLPDLKYETPSKCCLRFDDYLLELGNEKGVDCP